MAVAKVGFYLRVYFINSIAGFKRLFCILDLVQVQGHSPIMCHQVKVIECS